VIPFTNPQRHKHKPSESIKVERDSFLLKADDRILVTGASGFIGPVVIESLLRHGFRNVRAFARPSSDVSRLQAVAKRCESIGHIEVICGNLLSRSDCFAATKEVVVLFHLATGGGKSFPDAFMNSVITTRNLLEASREHSYLRRFVNISSFAVYANTQEGCLDEMSPIVDKRGSKRDAYTFAKVKQDEIVADYGKRFGIPYVTVRPGSVYGPGKEGIPGRVGIDTFGMFLHVGGSNTIPLTYVDNCADAIVLAGVTEGMNNEVFNVVDDNLPSSRQFLRMYKHRVKSFSSIYVPRFMSYLLCYLWEKYSIWSHEQLPPIFSLRRWRAEWKKTRYSNQKLKAKLGWTPKVETKEGLRRFCEASRQKLHG
jgi:nucleoside-diphosphate-sugar epimerase